LDEGERKPNPKGKGQGEGEVSAEKKTIDVREMAKCEQGGRT